MRSGDISQTVACQTSFCLCIPGKRSGTCAASGLSPLVEATTARFRTGFSGTPGSGV